MDSENGDITSNVRRRTKDDKVVVTYQGSTYDVTEFLDKHPGGRDILMSYAGQNVSMVMDDPTFHRHSEAAYSILQTYKISKGANGTHQNGVTTKDKSLHGWKEELVDWDKPMLAQVHKLGPEYMNWVHSPVDFKLRLFESQFVEFFSKTPWYIIPIIWIPVVLYFILCSVYNLLPVVGDYSDFIGNNIGDFPSAILISGACLTLGIFIWSLLEYILHRYLFHLTPPPDSPFWITLHFFLHGQHHKVPFDGDRLVFPPVAAAVFASLFYVTFVKALPLGIGQGLFAGGVLGYVAYDLTHYYLHHGSPTKDSYLERLKQYHVAHHFVNQSKGFGISSKFWDFPFGTLP